jgi:hypothetical protein
MPESMRAASARATRGGTRRSCYPLITAGSASSIASRGAAAHHRTMRLVECGGCNRHVREIETACPFCGASVSEVIAAAPHWDPPRGLSRAALFALAGAAIGASACGAPGAAYGAPAKPSACDTYQCPNGLACVTDGHDNPLCLCYSDQACGSGQVCRQGACETRCVTDSDCRSGETCKCPGYGICVNPAAECTISAMGSGGAGTLIDTSAGGRAQQARVDASTDGRAGREAGVDASCDSGRD